MAKGTKVKSCSPVLEMGKGTKVKTYACGGKVKR